METLLEKYLTPDNITFMWNADFAKIISAHQAICADKTKNSGDHLITG